MKIVLVDDDPAIVAVMQLLLEQAGHTVYSFPAGVDALPLIVRKMPDVIITDLMMAEMDGLAFCAEIKAHTELANSRVIMISARTDPMWKDKARNAGATGFIEKPIDPKTFAGQVQMLATPPLATAS